MVSLNLSIREEVVTSLALGLGPERNLLAWGPDHTRTITLDFPVIDNDELAKLQNIDKALTFARDVEAGIVWVNCFDHGDMTQPWGGFKQSGNGRDRCLEALTQYSQTKSVWVHLGG